MSYNSIAMLTNDEFNAYLSPLNEDQRECVTALRALVREKCPDLVEAIDEGKWFKGLITYTSPSGVFLYGLGPRKGGATTFHMMPFYGSAELKARHGEAFKKVLSGKSCIQFKRLDEVPMDAIADVLETGTAPTIAMWESRVKPTAAR